jgi:hypothetical protein
MRRQRSVAIAAELEKRIQLNASGKPWNTELVLVFLVSMSRIGFQKLR